MMQLASQVLQRAQLSLLLILPSLFPRLYLMIPHEFQRLHVLRKNLAEVLSSTVEVMQVLATVVASEAFKPTLFG